MSVLRVWPLLAIVALLIPATTGQSAAPQQNPTAGISEARQACLVTQKQHRRYVRAVYRRENVSKRALIRLDKMRRCAHSPKAARNMRKLQRHEGRQRRARARAERCTPFGNWAIPGYIVMKESKGQNVPNQQGSDASGYYQILRSTWLGAGGPDLPGRPRFLAMQFPKSVQDCVASRLWAGGRGSSHWALTR